MTSGVRADVSVLATIGGVSASYTTNGAGMAVSLTTFPATGNNATAGLLFCTNTMTYAPFNLSVDIRMSNTGSKFKVLQVSTHIVGTSIKRAINESHMVTLPELLVYF